MPRVIAMPLCDLHLNVTYVQAVFAMNDSFVCYGEFCQTPMVAPRGFEPHVSALKGPCPSPTRRRSHISLLLRPHLFLSGLLPQATYCVVSQSLIVQTASVVVERVNPCIRPLPKRSAGFYIIYGMCVLRSPPWKQPLDSNHVSRV